MLGKLAFWKKKAKEKKDHPATMFGCPDKAETAQREIDAAHRKSEAAQTQVMRVATVFGLEIDKLNGKKA